MGQSHLCSQTSKKNLKNKVKEYSELVTEATHLCIRCGRAANDKKALCSPAKISKLVSGKRNQNSKARKLKGKKKKFRNA